MIAQQITIIRTGTRLKLSKYGNGQGDGKVENTTTAKVEQQDKVIA